MNAIAEHVTARFEEAAREQDSDGRRIGAELKFPMVNVDGSAVALDKVDALWRYLAGKGWTSAVDELTGNVIGATRPGEQNDTVASCETGFCKPEFSLAHVANLADLEKSVNALRDELRPFADDHNVRFLGYGIQPVTPPSERLLMKKTRTNVWDRVFGANRVIDEADGDDVCLFTLNAATHTHLSVSPEEAVRAVNVLNGFAPAQIALTADSSVWRGEVDPTYKCVAEMFWDWWMPDANRVGVPPRRFGDLADYANCMARLKPVYVKRAGKPIVLMRYDSFEEYFSEARAVGIDHEGREVSIVPEKEDIDLHNTCTWYNARLTGYGTVENRVNDQQRPDELLTVPALTLGLVSALDEAAEEIKSYYWNHLRAAREVACRDGLEGRIADVHLDDLAERMLALAEAGLKRRALGEERFLAPLKSRLDSRTCPADEAAQTFAEDGVEALIDSRKL